MTGTRFERLEQRIRKMDEQVQTAEQVRTEKESSKYLEKAELFAYAALMPYYVPYALSKVLALASKDFFGPDGYGTKLITIVTYIFAGILLQDELKKYSTTVSDFVSAKKQIIKVRLKWRKNRKRAKIRQHYRAVKSKSNIWRMTAAESTAKTYQRIKNAPRRAASRIRQAIKRKPPNPN